MHRRYFIIIPLLLPAKLATQAPAARDSHPAVLMQYVKVADMYGSRLVAAFDSIPAARYAFRPTAQQQTVGYIAQHLEQGNYGLCESLGHAPHHRTAKDSLADTIKAQWPKDTLVARLRASLVFCDETLEKLGSLESVEVSGYLLAFETDLAEHYSQISNYMRLLGMVPPSALAPRARTAIVLPVSVLSQFVGKYELVAGYELVVTMRDTALFIRSAPGGAEVRLWPETNTGFFVKGLDAYVTFIRDQSGVVTSLVFSQYGRNLRARRMR